MKIAVSTISYYQEQVPQSEIYATFAKRLAKDIMEKTPFDFIVNTNRKDLFEEINNSPRIQIRDWFLKDHKTRVKAFNQLLKFSAIKDIDEKYDWVIYFDCDVGIGEKLNIEEIENYLKDIEANGFEMAGVRTNCTYAEEVERFKAVKNEPIINNTGAPYGQLFYNKFLFYGIDESLIGACFPSEHVFVVKNGPKLKIMAQEFEKLCYQFETQDKDYPVTVDMEAYEIGVSAHKANIKVTDLGNYYHCVAFSIKFNGNNLEKIKV